MRRRFLAAYDALAAGEGEKGEGGDQQTMMAEVVKALGEIKKEVTALLERDNFARFKVGVLSVYMERTGWRGVCLTLTSQPTIRVNLNQNTEAFAAVLQSLAVLLPTEPPLDEAERVPGKDKAGAAAASPRAASSAGRVGAA